MFLVSPSVRSVNLHQHHWQPSKRTAPTSLWVCTVFCFTLLKVCSVALEQWEHPRELPLGVKWVNPRCQYSNVLISNPVSLRARQRVILKGRQGARVGGVMGYVHSCTAQLLQFHPKGLTNVQGPHVMMCSPTEGCCGGARPCTVI